MKELKGIFPALLTPFDSNDKINEKELEKLVHFCLNKGATGFYVGGSTAETFLLTTEERKLIMDVVKSAAPDASLIAHIGSLNEKQATELALYAKELNYDVISSVAPFYYKFTFEEIKNYYFRLADAADLPMLVYHFPKYSGVNMGIAEMGQFLKDDRVCKDGATYGLHHGFCLETQDVPNAINIPYFKAPILRKGDKYDTTTEYKFK